MIKSLFTTTNGDNVIDNAQKWASKNVPIYQYVCLPPRYNKKNCINQYCYYKVPAIANNSNSLITCIPLNEKEHSVSLERSVLTRYKVPRNEALCGIKSSLYQFCTVKVPVVTKNNNSQKPQQNYEVRYGQIIETEWKQNMIYEPFDAHAKFHVRLLTEAIRVIVSPSEVTICSKIAYFTKPFEKQRNISVSRMTKLHSDITESILNDTCDEFVTILKSKANQHQLLWNQPLTIRAYEEGGRKERVILQELINTCRKANSKLEWSADDLSLASSNITEEEDSDEESPPSLSPPVSLTSVTKVEQVPQALVAAVSTIFKSEKKNAEIELIDKMSASEEEEHQELLRAEFEYTSRKNKSTKTSNNNNILYLQDMITTTSNNDIMTRVGTVHDQIRSAQEELEESTLLSTD